MPPPSRSLRNVFRREFITDFSRVEGVPVRGACGQAAAGGQSRRGCAAAMAGQAAWHLLPSRPTLGPAVSAAWRAC